jgi:UDP-N-acetylmuramate--alanine ligase
LLLNRGARCSGSDSVPSDLTRLLQASGIPVSHTQDGTSVPADCDLVIASAAIEPDHPELASARRRGIEVLSYPQALGRVQVRHTGISIAGTHGKSTTAAMLCHVLVQCGLDPSFIVGATCPQIGGGSRAGADTIPGSGPLAGQPGLLVAEACEFNRSFHFHRPVLGLIGNVEEDHLDVYETLDAIIEAFREFAGLLPPAAQHGRLFIAHDGAHRERITSGLPCAVETFGTSRDADYQVVFDARSRSLEVLRDGRPLARWTNTMPGEHNALNAAAAAILAGVVGAPWPQIAAAMDSFQGLDRRMQRLGQRVVNGGDVVVYDDYGHHPSEITATLAALRISENPRRLICVFQPHQHSRTRFLLEQFAASFSEADVVIVPDIYFVRDSVIEKHRVTAADLVDRLRQRSVKAMQLYPFEAIVEQLEVMCRDGDLVVIMGAGPVWQVARGFLARQQSSD